MNHCEFCGDPLEVVSDSKQNYFFCFTCKQLSVYRPHDRRFLGYRSVDEENDVTKEFEVIDKLEDMPPEFWDDWESWSE